MRQNAEAASVRLGALVGRPQAQLDGFKTRALRAETSTHRHMYTTEWRALDVDVAEADVTPVLMVGDEELRCERLAARVAREELAAKLHSDEWAAIAVAVATQRASLALLPLFALEVALTLVQTQASELRAPTVWLLSVGAQMGHRPAHTGAWGLARCARAEASLPLHCIDTSVTMAFARGPSLTEPEMLVHLGLPLVPRLARASQIVEPDVFMAFDSHIITGGTGGLGLLTGRWLAQRGACTLCLASRSGVLSHDMVREWEQVQASHVAALVQCCDTAQVSQVRRLVVPRHSSLPTTGVWHAAGVLADGLMPKQVAGKLARVYAPKAHGAWTLQRVCVPMPLRMCTLFSSIAASLGNAGQANYAAANACLDALAAYRRAHGCTGASVQWGAWAEVGMAARGRTYERGRARSDALTIN